MFINKRCSKIYAADEFDFEDVESEETKNNIDEDVDQDTEDEEDIDQDDVLINIDNNIEGKYIAECDRCGGIFISAVSVSDNLTESIHGICPLCDHDTDQFLKWYVASSTDLTK